MSTETFERRFGTLMAGAASLPLTKMEVAGAITGLLHHTKVCQTFVNDHQVPLEAIYTHPLPPKASVHGFRLVIGERVVEGRVQERRAARRAYSQAVAQGHRAALLEEERRDIFTTTVGNIAPGEQVSISFELSGPLEFLESTASLSFPLVVPELYISGAPLGGGDVGDGTASDTDSVPDASRITPPRLAPDAANPVNLQLSFLVDPAGLELESVESLAHATRTRRRGDGSYEISLLPGLERLDRDFLVRLKLREGSLQTTLVHHPESGAFALTVVPPLNSSDSLPPRDLVIVLDRSGSMQGWSMTAARRAALRMVESLTPRDRFNLIAFDDQLSLFEPGLVPAEARAQQRAAEFLAGVDSRGGTEARPAIERALRMLKGESASDKTVLFITDGDVGNDSELVVQAARGVRVSTVGIGLNSRAGVLQSMAQTSGGLCSLIPEESTLEETLRHLHQRLGRPHWMGLGLPGVDMEQPAPRYWDVWQGVPVTFFGQAAELGDQVTVEGWLAGVDGGQYSHKVSVQRRPDPVIHRSWARARLLELDDLWTIGKAEQQELVKLSEEAQVLCRFTAFAAIDLTETVANSQQSKTVVQPVEPTLQISGSRGLAPTHSQARPPMSPMPCPQPLASALPGGLAGGGGAPDPEAWADDEVGLFAGTSEAFTFAEEQADFDQQAFPPQLFGEPAPVVRLESPPPSCGSRARKALPAVKDASKARPARTASIWRRLLRLLEQLLVALMGQKLALLEQMIEQLGEHARQTPMSPSEETTVREVMSLLVDLQQTVQEGQEEKGQVEAVRSVLKSLDS
jgi:Ca-activated chloride channel family protein